MKINSKDINKALRNFYQNFDYLLENSYLFSWESDFFCIAKASGYMYEIEVKISRSDFKADFKKDKHEVFSRHKEKVYIKPSGLRERKWIRDLNGDPKRDEKGKVIYEEISSGIDYIQPGLKIPNRFYYCCPWGLLKKEEIPSYAGLLYYNQGHIEQIKAAPVLHKNNLLLRKRAIMMEKFYHQGLQQKRDSSYLHYQLESFQVKNEVLEKYLTAHGIDLYTGKKIDPDEADTHGPLRELLQKFLKHATKGLKVKIEDRDISKIAREFLEPRLSDEQKERFNRIR